MIARINMIDGKPIRAEGERCQFYTCSSVRWEALQVTFFCVRTQGGGGFRENLLAQHPNPIKT